MSSPDNWLYIDTKRNPADEGSRGLRAGQLGASKWITGPDFLWESVDEWETSSTEIPPLSNDDPEVKKAACMASGVSPVWPSVVERLEYFSNWQCARRAVALCLRYVRILHSKVSKTPRPRHYSGKGKQDQLSRPITIQELRDAEIVILKGVQRETLTDVSHSGPLRKLDPVTDSDGVIRVGGRLNFSALPDNSKYPAILSGISLSSITTPRYNTRAEESP